MKEFSSVFCDIDEVVNFINDQGLSISVEELAEDFRIPKSLAREAMKKSRLGKIEHPEDLVAREKNIFNQIEEWDSHYPDEP